MGTDIPSERALLCKECSSVWLSPVTHELISQVGGCLLCGGDTEEIDRPDPGSQS